MCVIKIGTMTELNGYLDYNGLIYKIQSVEQLRNFMNELGVEVKEMTKNELSSLCTNQILLGAQIRNIQIVVAFIIFLMEKIDIMD